MSMINEFHEKLISAGNILGANLNMSTEVSNASAAFKAVQHIENCFGCGYIDLKDDSFHLVDEGLIRRVTTDCRGVLKDDDELTDGLCVQVYLMQTLIGAIKNDS